MGRFRPFDHLPEPNESSSLDVLCIVVIVIVIIVLSACLGGKP